MRILSIETSCDDTGLALVDVNIRKSDFQICVEQNLISSQTKIHAAWGGVVPTLAKSEHLKNLPLLYEALLAKPYWLSPALIAVTVGPGLERALWAGIEFAKKLGEELSAKGGSSSRGKIPVIGANHLEGHMFSFLLPQKTVMANDLMTFPAIVLLVSGGNTILVRMDDINHWQKLGATKDDAVGEAFDKVARMLDLPYPGGPEIEKLAKKGNPNAINFPRPMLQSKDYNFSFSGLKTAALYHIKALLASGHTLTPALVADIAASFQQAAIEVLVKKVERALREFEAQSIILCGGVAANRALRDALGQTAEKYRVSFVAPAQEYNTDNAAMIAVAAYMRLRRRAQKYPLVADATLDL